MKLKFNYDSTETSLALKGLREIALATGIYSSHLRELIVKMSTIPYIGGST